MTAEVNEQVDMSDLDLLDGLRHAACPVCYPIGSLTFGDTFIASCGRTAMASGLPDSWRTVPNACPTCERMRYDECQRCGA